MTTYRFFLVPFCACDSEWTRLDDIDAITVDVAFQIMLARIGAVIRTGLQPTPTLPALPGILLAISLDDNSITTLDSEPKKGLV